MNDNDQNKLQDFRYLRRRLDFLRRESYEAAVLVGHLRRGAEKSGLASDNEVGYRIENTERLGEITEIEFVLEYFSRIAYVWSVRAQTVFAAVILFVFLVSLFAVVRMF